MRFIPVVEAVRVRDLIKDPFPDWLIGKPVTFFTDSVLINFGEVVPGDDWIVKGSKGEIYSCKDADFSNSYEFIPN